MGVISFVVPIFSFTCINIIENSSEDTCAIFWKENPSENYLDSINFRCYNWRCYECLLSKMWSTPYSPDLTWRVIHQSPQAGLFICLFYTPALSWLKIVLWLSCSWLICNLSFMSRHVPPKPVCWLLLPTVGRMLHQYHGRVYHWGYECLSDPSQSQEAWLMKQNWTKDKHLGDAHQRLSLPWGFLLGGGMCVFQRSYY